MGSQVPQLDPVVAVGALGDLVGQVDAVDEAPYTQDLADSEKEHLHLRLQECWHLHSISYNLVKPQHTITACLNTTLT